MSRNCSVCANAECAKIDAELVAKKDSIRGIARKYGVSDDALSRHRPHVEKRLVRAAEAREQADDIALAVKVERITARVSGWLDKAEKKEDWRALPGLVRELRSLLELAGRISGELTTPSTNVQVNVAAQPAAPAHPGQDFAHESPEDIAELLESELSAELGAEKFAAVVRLLAAALPVETTAEQFPITSPAPVIIPPLIGYQGPK
jgi:hypothetical protein